MKKTLTLLAGAAVGYVAGTRAGRERYEQIVAAAQNFTARPAVRDARERVKALAGQGAGMAGEKISAATSTAVDKATDTLASARSGDLKRSSKSTNGVTAGATTLH